MTHKVQGGLLPRWRLCSFTPFHGDSAAFPFALIHRLEDSLTLRQSRPTRVRRKTMTILDFALMLNAVANIVSAINAFRTLPRRPKARRRRRRY
jgi:hypothetical protein